MPVFRSQTIWRGDFGGRVEVPCRGLIFWSDARISGNLGVRHKVIRLDPRCLCITS